MALERDRLPQACRGRWAPAPDGAARITKCTSRSASFRSTPRAAGSSDAGSAGRLRARPKRHNTGSSYSARNRFTGVVRSVDNDGVMAWVEIEAGPFLVTAAITRDAMEELALAPRRTGDGRREGDLRDDQAHLRRSIWASRMRPTCGLVIGAPSVPDWATSNGLARQPLSVRSSRVRARPASLAPQYFKPVALGDLLSAASEARPAFDPDEARAPLDDGCASPLPDGRLPSRPRSAGLRAAAPRCSSHQRGADGLITGGLDARCGGEAPGARNGHG